MKRHAVFMTESQARLALMRTFTRNCAFRGSHGVIKAKIAVRDRALRRRVLTYARAYRKGAV